MRYKLFSIFFFCSLNAQTNDHTFLMQNCVQKVAQLESIKKKLLQDSMQHHEQLFYDLQIYAHTAGQVATSVILLTDKKEQKSNAYHGASRLSGNDKANIVQVVVTAFVLMVEFARFCHARKMHKKMVHAMTYSDFVALFPHLLLVEYQILLMKTLINLTTEGTLPEQIFAKITLTKMSLPYPYAKFANKAAKKMYKKSFDAFGNFVLFDLNIAQHPYKKFNKKVVQNWKELALKAESFAEKIDAHYDSPVACLVDTELNSHVIKMIHAGIKHDFETLEQVRLQFLNQPVVEKLFNYYFCQKS